VTPLTPRELRVIADHVERLTKARVVNRQLDLETTPDLMSVDFPNGFTGTVVWTPGQRSTDTLRQRNIERHARHRDSYQLDAATITITAAGASNISLNLAQGIDTASVRKAIAATIRKAGPNIRA
jgi:hypothetical protein